MNEHISLGNQIVISELSLSCLPCLGTVAPNLLPEGNVPSPLILMQESGNKIPDEK